jgi:hypothetical protein
MKTLLLACAAMAMATGANAAVVFDFGTIPDNVIPVVNPVAKTTGDLGQYALFTVAGLTIKASAFGPSKGGVADHVYGKNAGTGETGLGMTNDLAGQNEIYYGQGFLQIDLSALVGKVNLSTVQFAFNSTTGGEQWTIFGSNTDGVLGVTQVGQGTGQGTLATPSQVFTYYDIKSTVKPQNLGGPTGSGGNVLLKSLTVTPIPEPASWALMSIGLGGLGALLRRRRDRGVLAAA